MGLKFFNPSSYAFNPLKLQAYNKADLIYHSDPRLSYLNICLGLHTSGISQNVTEIQLIS